MLKTKIKLVQKIFSCSIVTWCRRIRGIAIEFRYLLSINKETFDMDVDSEF